MAQRAEKHWNYCYEISVAVVAGCIVIKLGGEIGSMIDFDTNYNRPGKYIYADEAHRFEERTGQLG